MTPNPARVLIVDDEDSIVWSLRKVVETLGLEACSVSSAERALEAAHAAPPQVVLLDVKLPGMNGLAALEEFRRVAPLAKVIVMSAHGSLDTVLKSQKQGALEYLPKPFDLDQVRRILQSALAAAPPNALVQQLRGQVAAPFGIVGRSRAMQELFKQVAAVAAFDTGVLLLGESGTGKELIARAIHQNSTRNNGPFEAINCASIPETLLESELYGHERGAFTGAEREKPGKLEVAHTGSILLDEVGDLPLSAQVKLLRFLEERTIYHVGGTRPIPVDVRVISATNQDLDARIREERFREDLFFRLNVVRIVVPPLRERREDIPLLAAHFLNREDGAGIDDEAMALLVGHSWPGNIRELRNTIERGVVLSRRGVLQREHLPNSIREPVVSQEADLDGAIRRIVDQLVAEAPATEIFRSVEARWEKALLRRVLEMTGGNQLKASEILGITRTTVKRKMDLRGF